MPQRLGLGAKQLHRIALHCFDAHSLIFTSPSFSSCYTFWACALLSLAKLARNPLDHAHFTSLSRPSGLEALSGGAFGSKFLICLNQQLTSGATEFKEIRKEWKQRKKEEEAQRKADEERQRQAAAAAAQNGGPDPQGQDGTSSSTYPGSRPVQLPPIGYQPAQYPAPPSGGVPQQPMPDYNTSHMYSNYQPHSPYGQPSQNMYNQCT